MNEEIKAYIDQKVREHDHNGLASQSVVWQNIFGRLNYTTTNAGLTTTTAETPTSPSEQLFVHDDGTNIRLYVFVPNDGDIGGTWRYVNLT